MNNKNANKWTKHPLFKWLNGVNLVLGILFIVTVLFIPIKNYDLIIANKTFTFFDLSSKLSSRDLILSLIGLLLTTVSFVPNRLCDEYLKSNKIKERQKLLTILAICSFISCIIGLVIFETYTSEITNAQTQSSVYLEDYIGSTIMLICSILLVISAFIKISLIIGLENGNILLEDGKFKFVNKTEKIDTEKNINQKNSTEE